jgi:hypothetical protein
MKKIHEILNLPVCKGDVGIEIEVEGEHLKPIEDDYWRTEDDGSLRGRFPFERSEYVLRSPIKISKVEEALTVLKEHQRDAELNFSFRCSVHVHINIGMLTHSQLLAYLYLVSLLEEPLMSFCGEERKGNRFCLRISDAEAYAEVLGSLFSHGPLELMHINANKVRYSAINIASIPKYGSLEFRGMRGNLDVDVIVAWCQTLYRLREYARKLDNPLNVYEEYINTSNIKFATKALGKNAKCYSLEDTAKLMDRSFSLTIEFPHFYKKYLEDNIIKKMPDEVEIINIGDGFNKVVRRVRPILMKYDIRIDRIDNVIYYEVLA